MKFITSVLSALVIFGVIVADEKCYTNVDTPFCNFKYPCKLYKVTTTSNINEFIDYCMTNGEMAEMDCTDDLLPCSDDTIDIRNEGPNGETTVLYSDLVHT